MRWARSRSSTSPTPAAFGRMPPCADPGFDHRSCDYWENAERGSKAARLAWLEPARRPRTASAGRARQPVPGRPRGGDAGGQPVRRRPGAANPFLTPGDDDDTADRQPVRAATGRPPDGRSRRAAQAPVARPRPRRRRQLRQGPARDDVPAVYAQFGPLTAYPRAQRTRDLYPSLPDAPLPAVITCIATTAEARGAGLASALVAAVCDDLDRARLHRRRDLPGDRRRPGRDERRDARVLGIGRLRRWPSPTSASRSCAATSPDRPSTLTQRWPRRTPRAPAPSAPRAAPS